MAKYLIEPNKKQLKRRELVVPNEYRFYATTVVALYEDLIGRNVISASPVLINRINDIVNTSNNRTGRIFLHLGILLAHGNYLKKISSDLLKSRPQVTAKQYTTTLKNSLHRDIYTHVIEELLDDAMTFLCKNQDYRQTWREIFGMSPRIIPMHRLIDIDGF